MKMDLIQPFINAADAVLAQGLQSPMSIGNLTMEEEAYRRKGVAALVRLSGDIEGRIIAAMSATDHARKMTHQQQLLIRDALWAAVAELERKVFPARLNSAA